MAFDVFISYPHQNKTTADAVCVALEADGIRCWIAPRDIVFGMDWGEAIIGALNSAKVMVLVFSGYANESPQIKREVERAVHKGIPIIPLRIEDIMPSKALEYFISTSHWLDALPPPLELHLKKLVAAVKTLLQLAGPDGEARPSYSEGAAGPLTRRTTLAQWAAAKERNPAPYFAAALLFVDACLMLIFGMQTVFVQLDALDMRASDSVWFHDAQDWVNFSFCVLTQDLIVFGLVILALTAGFGAIARKSWAPYVGLSVSVMGVFAVITVTAVSLIFSAAGVDEPSSLVRQTLHPPSGYAYWVVVMHDGRLLSGTWLYCWVFVTATSVSATILCLGALRPTGWLAAKAGKIPTKPRVFWGFVLFIGAMAAATLALALTPAWQIILFAIIACPFAYYCVARLRAEFSSSSVSPQADQIMESMPR
jgi:TIR domain